MFKKIWLKLRKKPEPRYDLNFLRGIEMFDKLKDNELMQLSDLFIDKHYDKDEIIFRDNYPSVVIYIVYTGKVKLYTDSAHTDYEVFIGEMRPQMAFGELGVFSEINRQVSAVCIEDSHLLALNKTDFIHYIKSNPGTGIKLLWNLGKTITRDFNNEIEKLRDYESKK
jgi:CRP-like cAMP-binding protein